jgi:hypothetical protein
MKVSGNKKRRAREATLLCQYLIGELPSETVIQTYTTIINSQPLSREQKKDPLLLFAKKNPWSLPFLDAGAALFKPESELRRRLHIMFAILECQPSHSDIFLPKKESKAYILVIAFTGCKAAFKALVGLFLIKALKA